MITVYQIHVNDEDIDTVNREGFDAIPKVAAKIRMSIDASKWKHDEYPKYYEATYEVDTDDLDVAFEATNIWEGYSVKRLKRGASSSVGDIFVKNGDCYIVDTFGFVAIGKYKLGV